MHIWTDLIIRELVMLVILLALGIGPASFLGGRFEAAARLAMAPVLGLCVGTCVFTSLIWFTPSRSTYWLIPVLALVSVVVALRRGLLAVADRVGGADGGRGMILLRRLRLRDVIWVVVVCVVVAAPLSYTLHERHSVGPMGFTIWDTVDYAAQPDAMEQVSLHQAVASYSDSAVQLFVKDAGRQSIHPTPPDLNYERLFLTLYGSGNQQIDAGPLSSNVDVLIGLHATDTQSAFLIVFLIAGALGAFAAVRYAAPKPSWVAPLAGVLFAGPFFLQLLADGSQAATCGLALILPIVAVGTDALRKPRLASLVLLALLASGLMALYPLFVAGVVFTAVIVLAVVAGVKWWRGQLTRRTVAWAAAQIGVVLGLSILFNLVSFRRDVSYWRGVLDGTYYIVGLPVYHLPYSVLPGWLFQTREFYLLTELGSTSAKQVLLGVILPIVFIATIVFGIRRHRVAMILMSFVLICAAMAEYTSAGHGCSYCTDRTLLPVAPLTIGLLALGVAMLATSTIRWQRWSAVAVAVVAVAAVGQRTREERLRVADGAYYLDASNRALLSHLPPRLGAVEIEGYGEDPMHAIGELPLVYDLVSERNHGEVSVPSEYNDYLALLYVGGPKSANPELNPNYRYVLTRLGGVQTGRRVVARTGSLALEERKGGLDATVVTGLAVPPVRLDADGLASVVGPMHLLVIGSVPGQAWISLRFHIHVPVTVNPQPGVQAQAKGTELKACVLATGKAPVRKGTLQLTAALLPGSVPAEPFALPEPPQGIQLVAMRAVTHCSVGYSG